MIDDKLAHLLLLRSLSDSIMKFIDETTIHCENADMREMNNQILKTYLQAFDDYGIAWGMIKRPHHNPDIEPILECWHRMKGLLKSTEPPER